VLRISHEFPEIFFGKIPEKFSGISWEKFQ